MAICIGLLLKLLPWCFHLKYTIVAILSAIFMFLTIFLLLFWRLILPLVSPLLFPCRENLLWHTHLVHGILVFRILYMMVLLFLGKLASMAEALDRLGRSHEYIFIVNYKVADKLFQYRFHQK